MPRGDRTGPAGAGPMTGRGAGLCTGNAMPGYLNPVAGRGFGMGMGMGMGRGRGAWGGGFGGRGAGLGMGRGGLGGRTWRHWYYATGLPGWMRSGGLAPLPGTPDAMQEKDLLRQQAAALRSEIDLINKRLGELEATEAGE